MKSEDNCRDWATKSDHRVNEHLASNGCCHICRGGFIENSFVNSHPDPKFKECHKECREDLPKPEPKSEVSEKRYDVSDEIPDRKWLDKTDDREYYHGHPIWTYDDNFMLEKMWGDGKSIVEIVDALTRMLPPG